jgi:hypothetical protein
MGRPEAKRPLQPALATDPVSRPSRCQWNRPQVPSVVPEHTIDRMNKPEAVKLRDENFHLRPRDPVEFTSWTARSRVS